MMKDKALATIKEYCMINEDDTVAVCLSGGADSMALFHFLCSEREHLKIKVMALHVNHGLRKESEEEEVWVKEYCRQMGAECVVLHAHMLENQKPQGKSTEVWARDIRYEFFDEESKKYSAKLATAHTLSDKVETVLFNITRGSGLKGAMGIPAVRDNIIRPLIDCTRAEIEDYCKENEISFVSDGTNFEEIYSRNKIRLRVIPTLKEINPSFERAVGYFAKENAEVYTFLTQLSDNLYRKSVGVNGFDVSIINGENPVVIKNLLRTILAKYDCLSGENIRALHSALSEKSYTRQLSQGVLCKIEDGHMFFCAPKKIQAELLPQFVSVKLDEKIQFLSKTFVFSVISYKEYEIIKRNDKNCLTYCANYDKINSALVLRSRKSGDKFTIAKRKVTKSLKKMFIEDKIPKAEREALAVLSDDTDGVIWLEGYGVNEDYAVDKSTQKILSICLL
ncbi:MAG: tRNA lysidine(34) synthetase TilS [Oscillospiraceae bacterium]